MIQEFRAGLAFRIQEDSARLAFNIQERQSRQAFKIQERQSRQAFKIQELLARQASGFRSYWPGRLQDSGGQCGNASSGVTLQRADAAKSASPSGFGCICRRGS
jgi:hypothetical protein